MSFSSKFLIPFLSIMPVFISASSHADEILKPFPTGIDLMSDLRDFADVMRDSDGNGSNLMDDPALTAVTKEYGPSVITNREFPYRSGVVTATVKPWSSWWYPKREDTLFRAPNTANWSPLQKYDYLRQYKYAISGRMRPKSAAEYESQNFNPNTPAWEGLCDAWALASIAKPEPKKPVTLNVNGSLLTFTVSDLKALLLKTYEASDDAALKYYGQKFTGDYSGWFFPDMFPDQFHRLLEVQLFQKKLPLIMDRDPGIEVWNVPVYKANYFMTSVPNEPNSVMVRAWLYSAESSKSDQKDFVGTIEVVREYNYVLQGTRNANGDLVINSGYWVKGPDGGVDSRREHPDFFAIIPDSTKLIQKSWNPEIEPILVNEILSYSY